MAGLSAAWRLLLDRELAHSSPTSPEDVTLKGDLEKIRDGLRVTVIEGQQRLGGNIHSERQDGFLLEWGPNGFLDNAPETPRLCRLLGLEKRLLPARDAAAHRFLYVRGRLRPLPLSPAAFLGASVLTIPGRLRVLREPFVPPRPDARESVFDFAARRIGREAAETLVDAMVSGVFGGDSRQLNLSSAFPKLHTLEKEHGGLVRGMIAKAREARRERGGQPRRRSGPAGPGGVLTSFDEGMEVLVQTLARALGQSGRCGIETGVAARATSPRAPGSRPTAEGKRRWTVSLADGRSLEADAVIICVPSQRAGVLVRDFDPQLETTLRAIPEAPMSVVALAFTRREVGAMADGFGFLVPRRQGPRVLGVLWDSCIYPNRAPEEMVLMRAMLGGAHDPAAMDLTDEAMLATVRDDLRLTMGLAAEPVRTWIFRHRHGIPQYTAGHPERLEAIEQRRLLHPGLYLAGNSYRGIAVNHVVENSIPLARQVLAGIRQTTGALPPPGFPGDPPPAAGANAGRRWIKDRG